MDDRGGPTWRCWSAGNTQAGKPPTTRLRRGSRRGGFFHRRSLSLYVPGRHHFHPAGPVGAGLERRVCDKVIQAARNAAWALACTSWPDEENDGDCLRGQSISRGDLFLLGGPIYHHRTVKGHVRALSPLSRERSNVISGVCEGRNPNLKAPILIPRFLEAPAAVPPCRSSAWITPRWAEDRGQLYQHDFLPSLVWIFAWMLDVPGAPMLSRTFWPRVFPCDDDPTAASVFHLGDGGLACLRCAHRPGSRQQCVP